MCQLSLPGFDGSADALLALVAGHKLGADQVPVAEVTKQFFCHMTKSESLDLQLAGELMAASARLMVLKSAHLLIQPLVEDDEDAVQERPFDPAVRQGFREAIDSLAVIEGRESFLPFRPPMEIERRPEPRSPVVLQQAWTEMNARSDIPRHRLVIPGFVRLEVAVSGLIRALRSGTKLRFRQLVRASSRRDTVVQFMAMLELARQKRVYIEQDELFGEITVRWVPNSAETSQVG